MLYAKKDEKILNNLILLLKIISNKKGERDFYG